MTAWYEITRNDAGQFSFVLRAADSQVVLRSGPYASKASAHRGIASVQTNAPRDARYELATAGDGRFHFNLKAANTKVIGTSPMYRSEDARKTGIESVKANGTVTEVRMV